MAEKRLLTNDDMKLWESSDTRSRLVEFIETLAESIRGHENTDYELPISDAINSLLSLLQKINQIVDKYPVVTDSNTSRFGKIEFRDFLNDIETQSTELIKESFHQLTKDQIYQLSTYLIQSWGDKRRIDYGSGHELNFICFLYGLTCYKQFSIKGTDAANLVLKVFIEYLKIMRILETKYWLEPAGSHGVWGLDDYHFLPFLFGAFQLSTHKHLKPKSIHNNEVVEMFANRYLYFGCIAFINSVKTTASLRWHSPMLDDISGVKQWSKVAEGMVKMYKAEVLNKLPIMQHFYFSEFLPCPDGVTPSIQKSSSDSYDNNEIETRQHTNHLHTGWGDCCGIKIPSAIAASQMNNNKNQHHHHQQPKPLPFD